MNSLPGFLSWNSITVLWGSSGYMLAFQPTVPADSQHQPPYVRVNESLDDSSPQHPLSATASWADDAWAWTLYQGHGISAPGCLHWLLWSSRSLKSRGKSKWHWKSFLSHALPAPCSPPSSDTLSTCTSSMQTSASLTGFSHLLSFLSSWTLHLSHIYRLLGVDFNGKRLQSMLVHYLNNRYIRSTEKRNICFSTRYLHFGFLFKVDQFSKHCLDKIKLESVHSDRFMGPSWQMPI